ncbi:MAG TPA: hypothetical protein VHG89_04720 [Verrucomicrobiae bacterium]|nr:hypothetical protein [Verrucomicrobiae bacterium]
MKPSFHEDYVSDKLDPLATPMHEDFNWNELYQRLGEPTDQQLQDEKIAEFIRKLFEWVTAIDLRKENSQTLIGRRFIALAWVFNPALFEDSPSASKLAETLRITRKADLWKLTGEVTRHFGITNRGQSHAWNRGVTRAEQCAKQAHDSVNGRAIDSHMAEPMAVKESFMMGEPKQGHKQT